MKPPYGRITAYNMNTGDVVFQVANGDSYDWVKTHPALLELFVAFLQAFLLCRARPRFRRRLVGRGRGRPACQKRQDGRGQAQETTHAIAGVGMHDGILTGNVRRRKGLWLDGAVRKT